MCGQCDTEHNAVDQCGMLIGGVQPFPTGSLQTEVAFCPGEVAKYPSQVRLAARTYLPFWKALYNLSGFSLGCSGLDNQFYFRQRPSYSK